MLLYFIPAIFGASVSSAEIFLPRVSQVVPSSDFSWVSVGKPSQQDFVKTRPDGIVRGDLDRILEFPTRNRNDLMKALLDQLKAIELALQTRELSSDGRVLSPDEIAIQVASDKFQKDWKKSTDRARVDAVRFFIHRADALKTENGSAFATALAEALAALEALAIEVAQTEPEPIAIAKNGAMFFPQTIAIGREEARNVPAGKPSTPADPVDNNFWRKPTWNISDFDLTTYGGQVPNRNSLVLDPSVPVRMVYKKKTFGGFSPKIRAKMVTPDHSGKRRDFKVKLTVPVVKISSHPLTYFTRAFGSGSEARSETVANQIVASIGYAVQPTYFKHAIHLYFDGQTSYAEVNEGRKSLIRDLTTAGKFGPTVWSENVDLVFPESAIGKDSKGHHYVLVRDVALEEYSSPDTDFDLGGWSKGGLGRSKLREHRAAAIIHALFHDSDCKESNAAVRVKQTVNGYSLYYVLSDLGFAFGGVFLKDMPNLYDWNLVDWSSTVYSRTNGRSELQKLVLTYRPYQKLDIMNAATFDDARWIVRRLAQLKVDQIEASFLGVRYPKPVAKLLADKVFYRIQDLSEALGLAGSWVCADSQVNSKCFALPRRPSLDRARYSVRGYEGCFESGELIPCKEVPSEFTFSLRGRINLSKDANGQMAPQLTWFSEVPKKLWEGLVDPLAKGLKF